MSLEKTWRWFGPHDPVKLADARQAGASGIITALHQIPTGEVWQKEAILERKGIVEKAGMTWSVAESINVHEDVKLRTGEYKQYLENYKQSIRNMGECGIDTVCYNFMPLLDATRTNFSYALPNGAKTLRFDRITLIAFDLFILKRTNAEADYSEEEQSLALDFLNKLDDQEKDQLISTLVAGFPNVGQNYSLENLRDSLQKYIQTGRDGIRQNLAEFIGEVTPVAEEAGVYLTIHPDDPPYSILGLPRVVSTSDDLGFLLGAYESDHNGICFCAGSLGVRPDNDVPGMVKQFSDRINFIHLRNIKREENGAFIESDHLDGV
ncbi:MAG: mannonate dehydratase, partial [Cyclobacteriaceae bacterium]